MPVHIHENDFSLFRSVGRVQQLPANTTIFTQGDPAETIYLVTSGRVRVFSLSSAGKENTLEILESGRIFGDSSFLSGAHRSVTIQTVTETEIVVCQAEALLHLCHQSEELMMLLFQHMTDTCNYLTHQITRLIHYDSRQKVADFLLCESASRDRLSHGDPLPYTHEEIAESVSLNRVTVSRILKDFRLQGWIDSRYGAIRILQRESIAGILPDNTTV